MEATTFADDTPLVVTELIAQNGIVSNCLWWNADCFLLREIVEKGKYNNWCRVCRI